ncbi:H-NS histone family protein [Salmonella enterica]|uniref:H-NS histone family protein n=1 Tax=Salmonella enterica TaxID=28901 RepID=UPI00107DCB50|nr:H-NS family nucleoid-associated regulatory protein [Salmonella enterica]EAW1671928.1 DNA-binding protein [Salmonella enterica subsp. enterica]EGF6410851.1 H-NS histone family protein [Salmonella enterica subsp. enterica serovar 6,8:d:-]EAA2824258.1 DNA-binding protein [Salmonella enterica]EAM7059870.1 DNA-binding protein [Salmonella enterica]EAZ8453791.1 DNA-binding protein [Salmonella enterica]
MAELSKEEEHGITARILMNIRSVRVFAREMEFEQLLEMQEKLNAVIEERREDAEREAAERQEREKKRQELLQLIAGEGFSPEELLGLTEDTPKTRKKTLPKAPPKYQFDENGETKYWSGRGRTPKPIDEALKAGRSLDEFLIKKDASSSVGDEQ